MSKSPANLADECGPAALSPARPFCAALQRRTIQVPGDSQTDRSLVSFRHNTVQDTEVMQAVVKPLLDFREHEIKEVSSQRKRLENRRLGTVCVHTHAPFLGYLLRRCFPIATFT